MRDVLIAINRYYSNNKIVIWLIIVIVGGFLLVTTVLRKISYENNNSSSGYATTIVADNNINSIINGNNDINNTEQKTDEDIISEAKSDESVIKTFAKFCNEKKTSSAYSMLSDDCKTVLYPTEQDFIEKYYNTYFSGNKDIQLTIQNSEKNVYKVDYLEDILATGNAEHITISTDYITVDYNKKINLSGFINRSSVNKISSNKYVRINVLYKNIFYDHVEYEIKADNLISPEIYLDSIEVNSKLYITCEDGKTYKLDTSNYYADDFKIGGNESKLYTLKFIKSCDSADAKKMNFDLIRIINYQYGDSNTESEIGQSVDYKMKSTTYPSVVTLQVDL